MVGKKTKTPKDTKKHQKKPRGGAPEVPAKKRPDYSGRHPQSVESLLRRKHRELPQVFQCLQAVLRVVEHPGGREFPAVLPDFRRDAVQLCTDGAVHCVHGSSLVDGFRQNRPVRRQIKASCHLNPFFQLCAGGHFLAFFLRVFVLFSAFR